VICSSGYERRKAPEKVRAALIDAAAMLIAQQGLSRLTIDGVARAAGVTKGGLFHHFASKDDLILGVVGAMIDSADADIAGVMADDPEPHGSFTRAYLSGVFGDPLATEHATARTLCMAMLADPRLQNMWFNWVRDQVAKHAATDDNTECALVRLAADGAWLNSLCNPAKPVLHAELVARLTDLTRPDP
jgi:AcrR family transcriptional regulator